MISLYLNTCDTFEYDLEFYGAARLPRIMTQPCACSISVFETEPVKANLSYIMLDKELQ